MAGNATLIGELMANLADNALRYSPPSTVVTLSVVAAAEGFTLLVDDQGPGIPADRREEVFNRFVRLPGAHLAGGVEGCGLGLAIVREIAQAHGAVLRLEDAPGGGLRVRVRFPAAAAPVAEDAP